MVQIESQKVDVQSFAVRAGCADPVADLCDQITSHGPRPDIVICQHDADLSAHALQKGLAQRTDTLHCATSCTGAITQDSQATASPAGVFCIWDRQGDYGTACVSSHDHGPKQAAIAAVSRALSRAGRVGEVPDLVWISPTPGQEEQVLEGIASVIGPDVPVIGGSAADNAVAGAWTIADASDTTDQGVLVSVLFPSGHVSFAYQNGYAPTNKSGIVTRATGRHLVELDGQNAAQTYATWSDGQALAGAPKAETNILAAATLAPLGKHIGDIDGVPNYLLVHPATAHPDGALDLFAEVAEGDVLTQMQGDMTELANRAGRVAQQALNKVDHTHHRPIGALMIYCGGCLMAVQDRLDVITSGVNSALGGLPYLGGFTFGEQGPILRSGNKHGNLMISCVTFSKARNS